VTRPRNRFCKVARETPYKAAAARMLVTWDSSMAFNARSSLFSYGMVVLAAGMAILVVSIERVRCSKLVWPTRWGGQLGGEVRY